MLSEYMKIDIAIPPTNVSSSGTTGKYFSMKDYDWACFVWSVTSLGVLLTSTGTVYQAKDASAATSAAGLASTTAIITGYTKATTFTITPTTSLVTTDTIAITSYDLNGTARTALTFTASDAGLSAGTSDSGREFTIGISAGDSASKSTSCTYLAAIINNETYGLIGAYATASTTTVIVRSMEPGDTVFTMTSSTTTNLTVSINESMGMIEVHSRAMTLSSNFTHLALNLVNNSACYSAAFIIRGKGSRYNYAQAVGALTQLA